MLLFVYVVPGWTKNKQICLCPSTGFHYLCCKDNLYQWAKNEVPIAFNQN